MSDTTAQHMIRMYYALMNFTNPQPDDDPYIVMALAKQAIEMFHDDPTQCVTVDMSDDCETQGEGEQL